MRSFINSWVSVSNEYPLEKANNIKSKEIVIFLNGFIYSTSSKLNPFLSSFIDLNNNGNFFDPKPVGPLEILFIRSSFVLNFNNSTVTPFLNKSAKVGLSTLKLKDYMENIYKNNHMQGQGMLYIRAYK